MAWSAFAVMASSRMDDSSSLVGHERAASGLHGQAGELDPNPKESARTATVRVCSYCVLYTKLMLCYGDGNHY
jgi:hypothetical protein